MSLEIKAEISKIQSLYRPVGLMSEFICVDMRGSDLRVLRLASLRDLVLETRARVSYSMLVPIQH
jgi:hypothetical protein